jgi:hypothetical protein
MNEQEEQVFPDYKPTRPELVILARYWMRLWYDNTMLMWTGRYGSGWMLRQNAYATSRLNQIDKLLGKEEFTKVQRGLEDELLKAWGEPFAAFLRGDDAWLDYQDDPACRLETP